MSLMCIINVCINLPVTGWQKQERKYKKKFVWTKMAMKSDPRHNFSILYMWQPYF